jgi:hypothetical protein
MLKFRALPRKRKTKEKFVRAAIRPPYLTAMIDQGEKRWVLKNVGFV